MTEDRWLIPYCFTALLYIYRETKYSETCYHTSWGRHFNFCLSCESARISIVLCTLHRSATSFRNSATDSIYELGKRPQVADGRRNALHCVRSDSTKKKETIPTSSFDQPFVLCLPEITQARVVINLWSGDISYAKDAMESVSVSDPRQG